MAGASEAGNVVKAKFSFSKKDNKYPNSKYLSRNGFYLPSYLDLKKKEIDFICQIVNKVIKWIWLISISIDTK